MCFGWRSVQTTVFGIPGRVVRSRNEPNEVLEHGKLPDPQGQALEDLKERIEHLEAELQALKEERVISVSTPSRPY